MRTTACYRNLHKNCISKKRGNDRVEHCDRAILRNVRFTVREGDRDCPKHGTRQWVLKNRSKAVHAFVKGYEVIDHLIAPNEWETWEKATYNPYKQGYFYDCATGEPVYTASIAVVTTKGVFYLP